MEKMTGRKTDIRSAAGNSTAAGGDLRNLKKAAAGIIGVMVLVIVLLSSLYVSLNTEHDCKGEHCPVCACVQACENVLRQVGSGIPAAAAMVLAVVLLYASVILSAFDFVQDTLISEKVRMND